MARYSGADSADAAAAFADEVFATIRTGATRVTDEIQFGHRIMFVDLADVLVRPSSP